MSQRLRWSSPIVLLVALCLSLAGCGGSGSNTEPTKSVVSLGTVKINSHPASLEGTTIVLRWNGKPNGDKFLTRIGELLVERIKDVRVIKLWEKDPTTAGISKSVDDSRALAGKIAALKPDLVIASQAD